jgi:hypothetical protein
MGYFIEDKSSSIRFVLGTKDFFLKKSSIKEISVVRADIIRINCGSCMGSIFIRHKDVTNPVTASAAVLALQLNTWLTVAAPGGGSGGE